MVILSHRGYWQELADKNSLAALRLSFQMGFGTETDFRDLDGRLVISHDPPGKPALDADLVFESLSKSNKNLPLAINIKSDGLQRLLQDALTRHSISDYFLFDMSVPDAIVSLRFGLNVFTRQSDVEVSPVLYKDACGVWLDAFYSYDWLTEKIIEQHLCEGKRVCIVSPEIHGLPHESFWWMLKEHNIYRSDDLMICTDYPKKCSEMFGS